MRKSQLKKNILIVRLSSPGDIVLAAPMAGVIKKYNPNAYLVWAVQPESKDLLINNPNIDELYLWDKRLWQELWKKKRLLKLIRLCIRTHKELKDKHFEIAYDIQGLFKSGLITWLSGAKERIGIGSREGSYIFMHRLVSRNIANRDQIGAEYRYLVSQLGYSDSKWQIGIKTSNDAQQRAADILAQHIQPNESFAVICPFTTREQKHWKEAYWQQLLLRVRGRYQFKTLILGASHEADRGKDLARKCGAINLAGTTGFQEAAEIIKRSSLAIGVDNALTHMSQASDTPSIAIFGPSRPYLYTENENSKVLHLDRYCSPCRRKPICQQRFECMTEITPDHVLAELRTLIKDTKQRNAFI